MTMPRSLRAITAVAPGKVILFGEHAINRGQPALSASVGLTARCTVTAGENGAIRLRSKAPTSPSPTVWERGESGTESPCLSHTLRETRASAVRFAVGEEGVRTIRCWHESDHPSASSSSSETIGNRSPTAIFASGAARGETSLSGV